MILVDFWKENEAKMHLRMPALHCKGFLLDVDKNI